MSLRIIFGSALSGVGEYVLAVECDALQNLAYRAARARPADYRLVFNFWEADMMFRRHVRLRCIRAFISIGYLKARLISKLFGPGKSMQKSISAQKGREKKQILFVNEHGVACDSKKYKYRFNLSL